MKRPALQNKRVRILQMAFRARKVSGTFEKQVPEPEDPNSHSTGFFLPVTVTSLSRFPNFKKNC